MKTVDTLAGVFDEHRYRELEAAYNRALKTGQAEFIFGSTRLLTHFTKHLLDYLKREFSGGP